MIPEYNLNGVLPPFVGQTPGGPLPLSSPYQCSPLDIVERFSSTEKRTALLRGLFRFREALRQHGLSHGFQWLDGSFTEDVEALGREPRDIDVVTLAYRPQGLIDNEADWADFVNQQRAGGIFDRAANRRNFDCDASFVDLHTLPHIVARHAAYWSGLFSHRRLTFEWKGMLALPLHIDDAEAIAALEGDGDE